MLSHGDLSTYDPPLCPTGSCSEPLSTVPLVGTMAADYANGPGGAYVVGLLGRVGTPYPNRKYLDRHEGTNVPTPAIGCWNDGR